jgi:hypothetical protein
MFDIEDSSGDMTRKATSSAGWQLVHGKNDCS